MKRTELASLSHEELVHLIFYYARCFGAISEELDRRAGGDERTLELAAALDALSRLLRDGTSPNALLAALTPLLSEPDPVN